jgi:hypothetical protein
MDGSTYPVQLHLGGSRLMLWNYREGGRNTLVKGLPRGKCGQTKSPPPLMQTTEATSPAPTTRSSLPLLHHNPSSPNLQNIVILGKCDSLIVSALGGVKPPRTKTSET